MEKVGVIYSGEVEVPGPKGASSTEGRRGYGRMYILQTLETPNQNPGELLTGVSSHLSHNRISYTVVNDAPELNIALTMPESSPATNACLTVDREIFALRVPDPDHVRMRFLEVPFCDFGLAEKKFRAEGCSFEAVEPAAGRALIQAGIGK